MVSQSTTDNGHLLNNNTANTLYNGAWPVSGDLSVSSGGDKMAASSPRSHSSTPALRTTLATVNNFAPRIPSAQNNIGAAAACRRTSPDCADKFAPDLSDMEFETAPLAIGMSQTGGGGSTGTAWSMEPSEQQNRHLISPSGANACGRSISLINAMQSCDLVTRENQKTASYVPVMNSSVTSTSPTYTGPPTAVSNHNNNYHLNENKQQPTMPSRMAPNPPRKSSLPVSAGAVKPSQTVELDDNEEIFEISV